jgi:hypothetical protein
VNLIEGFVQSRLWLISLRLASFWRIGDKMAKGQRRKMVLPRIITPTTAGSSGQ